jgi:hypothetical protein
MAVIDARHTSGEVTYGQAEALKTLIATTPAPLGPGPLGPALLGFHPGMAGGGMMHDQGDMNVGGMHGGNTEGGGMRGGVMSGMDGMGGMQGGDMPAGQGGMAPAQEEQGGRHGRGRR